MEIIFCYQCGKWKRTVFFDCNNFMKDVNMTKMQIDKDLFEEYDFSQDKVKKYYERYTKESNVVVINSHSA